jgi:folate-binding protein YgfZ
MTVPIAGPIAADYRAARESAIAVDLSAWAVLRVTGPDARAFLQGVATQDLEEVSRGVASPTFFLNEKGRPIALAWVRIEPAGNDAWIVADGGTRDALRPHFERFRVMEDVAFEGPDGMPVLMGFVGPQRDRLLRQAADSLPGAVSLAADPISFLLVAGGPHGGGLPRPMDPSAFEAWRLSVGIPLAGIDYGLERIATELSYPSAISSTKGCYVGQEVVSRTSTRGNVRRRRVGFRFRWDGAPLPPRAEIRAGGATAGYVTSAAREPEADEGLGMGYFATEAPAETAEVTVPGGLPTTRLNIRPWPL